MVIHTMVLVDLELDQDLKKDPDLKISQLLLYLTANGSGPIRACPRK